MSRTPWPGTPASSLFSFSGASDASPPPPSPTPTSPSSPAVPPLYIAASHACQSAAQSPSSAPRASGTSPCTSASHQATPSPFPAHPPSPPNPYHAYAFLTKKKDYSVDCTCGHFNIHMQGNGTANEVLTACVGKCCLTPVNLIAETVADLILTGEWKLDFQEMLHASVRTEVLNLPNNESFASFFHRCAAIELNSQLELTRARFTAMQEAAAIARTNSHGEIPTAFDNLSTASRVASAPGSDTLRYVNFRSVNGDRFPYGVIPPDGVVNRNLNPTFQSMVARLPTRTVSLTPSVDVTYYDVPVNSEPPYYWVPYGFAIGIFANPQLYYSVWSSGRGSEGHEVFSLDEAHAAMENALLEGRFGLIR
ncbi:hypothetical protein CONPUDRAFT_69153 [Coniophora puteana RWD-64-598 SS2]|uniref:Uncharacterized protein n=1 Tax=Coniophora puteana (strain RWD-64-598) TaxID=741705 RepID=A0A5M3N5R6_CONPW|nr:uncharacterized protein CONPUDRAFT_69153 [Coniophora puteana RWD-64-598 SS2]EIW86723.1 hypothetical protein CONPUDRAFT_69153 [Coniophora puteana RWD-64-598 SS2]